MPQRVACRNTRYSLWTRACCAAAVPVHKFRTHQLQLRRMTSVFRSAQHILSVPEPGFCFRLLFHIVRYY